LPAATPARSRRDLKASLLLGLLCLLVYNANLRSINAGDTYAARYLPFGIWRYHTILLDPIATLTAQGWAIPRPGERTGTAYWIVRARGGHAVSLYPVVVPVIIAPLYLPAVLYLNTTGWDQPRLERVARVMEKLSASLLAAMSAALLYLLLRRRAARPIALLLTVAYAFGTTTWVVSSQALWQHGLSELLIVAALFLLTGPCTARSALAAGLICGLIACNRPPDAILAAALGIYGLRWARRLAPLLVAAAALPGALLLAYNLGIVGNVAGAYALVDKARHFFKHDLLSGLAGLLFSPTRGLFVFSPFLLALPFCVPRALRDLPARNLTKAVGFAMVLQVLLYAKADWIQGASWGPRWLTDFLPVLLWMLPPGVSAMRGAGRILFVSAVGVAIAIQAIGAFWYIGASDSAIYAFAQGPARMHAAWDLRNTPFIAELRHAPAPFELAVDVRGSLDLITTTGVAGAMEIDAAGWALAAGHSPRQVTVLLDGQAVVSTASFFPRPDVTRALGYTSPSGWRVSIPPRNLAPGEHVLSALAQAYEGGEQRFLAQRRFTVPVQPPAVVRTGLNAGGAESADLALSARRAAAVLASHQQVPGYWLTSFTKEPRFERPRVEMNTFLTSIMIDVLNPVAAAAGLSGNVQRARHFLAAQIEDGGLVRYHGLPGAPTIGTLGCVITPDADDTALVWRIAPGPHPGLLASALATLARYRTPDGLYRTWLAPQDHYECIDPGKDPNPADIGIQMHVLMLLAHADPPAARALCHALGQAIGDSRIWVYYQTAPLIPILRQADLQTAGCPLPLPPSRLHTAVPGQQVWIAAAAMLQRIQGVGGPAPASPEVADMLRSLSHDDFSPLRQAPPLLYHNDLSASVRRFYWSEDVGYALWLRLYFENAVAGRNRVHHGV
jgi:hypothetical protein